MPVSVFFYLKETCTRNKLRLGQIQRRAIGIIRGREQPLLRRQRTCVFKPQSKSCYRYCFRMKARSREGEKLFKNRNVFKQVLQRGKLGEKIA